MEGAVPRCGPTVVIAAAKTTREGVMRMTRVVLTAVVAAAASAAGAQQWPTKPVRLIVPFAPGGGTDVQARLLTAALQNSTGQSFIVDNRTGASGLIAYNLTIEQPPDGYTVLFTSGSISVVSTLYASRMKFNPLTDFTPVTWLSSTPLVLSLHPSVPAKSPKELIALAKRVGISSMNAGGNTFGSTAHLSAELFNQMAGLKSQVITYRGGGPATVALISGETDYILASCRVSNPTTGTPCSCRRARPRRSSIGCMGNWSRHRQSRP
jgi:tripartite-type tricarboxylate transporter receptor subunit TctC